MLVVAQCLRQQPPKQGRLLTVRAEGEDAGMPMTTLRNLAVLLMILDGTSSLPAQTALVGSTIELECSAPEFDRGAALLEWRASPSELQGECIQVRAEDARGVHLLPSQCTRAADGVRVLWRGLPQPKGTTIRYRLSAPRSGGTSGLPAQPYSIGREGESLFVKRKDGPSKARTLFEHVLAESGEQAKRPYKPFDHLYEGSGAIPVTSAGSGKFAHHRGVFLGWNQVRVGGEVSDFWHLKAGACMDSVTVLEDSCLGGEVCAETGVRVRWSSPALGLVLSEERRVRVLEESAEIACFDYDIKLESLGSRVVLQGDPHHAGFHVRAHVGAEDRESENEVLVPASAERLKDDIWQGTRSVAFRFRFGSDPVVVVLVAHPGNPSPLKFSARPYGRIGSFSAITIEAGLSVNLRFRVIRLTGASARALDVPELERRQAEVASPPGLHRILK